MKIREAALDDAGVIAQFNINLAWETEHLKLGPETVAAGVKRLIQNRPRGVYYVAEESGRVVGQLCLTYEWSDWRNGNFWWIQSVYVEAAARGRGVFTALFEHVQSLARADQEVCGLRLYMEQDNERARRAYLKLGLLQTHYQVFEKGLR
jgi:GNAT superfamily N-acetyltransferase